jgi:hypothetical protein
MEGKNKAESSSSRATYRHGGVKLEWGMSVVMNGSAPGHFLYGRGGEPRRQEGVMAASEVLFNDDGYGESKQWGGFGSMQKEGERAALVSGSGEEGSRRGGSHPRGTSVRSGATWRREEGGDRVLGWSWAEIDKGIGKAA